MNSAEKLRRLMLQMAAWGFMTVQRLNNADLIYGVSRHGFGLPIEIIVRDGYVTFLSLDDLYYSDYATSDDHQAEAIQILECVVGGGATLLKTAHGCHLLCGNFHANQSESREPSRRWAAWCEPVVVEYTISLPVRCY